MLSLVTRPRSSQWGEIIHEPAIDSVQKQKLWSMAKRKWTKNQLTEFRYWLTCRGYYEIIDRDTWCPKYLGTVDVIPLSHLSRVERELR